VIACSNALVTLAGNVSVREQPQIAAAHKMHDAKVLTFIARLPGAGEGPSTATVASAA
jgi:hypothetical protein